MARADITLTAVDQTRAAFDSVKRNLAGLEGTANTLRSTLAGIGVGLSAGAFVGFVRNSIDAADALDDVAQKSGVAVESLSALGYAAKIEGISVDDLGGSLVKLSVNLQAAANGSAEMQKAFAAVGVSAKDLQNIRPDEAFLRIAEAFRNTEDGAAKSALAVRLFGRAGADLIPLLNQGRTGLSDLGDEARRLGLIISADSAAAAARFNDNLTKLSASASSFGIQLGNVLLPALTRFTDEMLEGVRIFGSFSSAFVNIGVGIDPFKGLGDNLKKYRGEVERLSKLVANPELKGTKLGDSLRADLDTAQKQLEFLKFQERQRIQAGGEGNQDARDRRLAEPPRRSALPDVSAAAATTETDLAAGAERGARLFTQIYLDQFNILAARGKEVQAGLLEVFEAGNETDARNLKDAADNLDRILGTTRSGQEAATFRDLEAINDALITGRINAAQYEEAYVGIQERLNQIRGIGAETFEALRDDGTQALRDLEFAVQGWGRNFTDTLATALETGKLNFADLVRSVLRDLVRLQIQQSITRPLFNALSGALGSVNLFGGASSSPGAGIGPGAGQGLRLGPGRAAGGAVNAGQAYMVGERGPELFIPPTAGMISPTAGRSITQVFNIAPGVDAGVIYRAAQMGASMAKSDIARGMRIGEMG
jgi:hypothetical protein